MTDTVPFWKALLAGSAGGVANAIVGHPFETVKVRLQCGEAFSPKIFRGIFSGVLSPIVGTAPFWGCSYLGYNAARKAGYTTNSPIDLVARGMLVGSCSTAIRTPVDCVKIVAQHDCTSSPVALKKIISTSGPQGVFRGFSATFLWLSISATIFWGAADLSRSFLTHQCGFEPGALTELLSGGMAGVIEWNICLPFDTFKTRVQASSGSSLRQVWDKLILEQGYTGLYKGYVPVMMRAFPANAAPFFVISIVKSWLENI